MQKIIKSFVVILIYTTIYAQPVITEHVEVELVSEVSSIKSGQQFWVALRFQHNPEWHTYWRNAGDAGLETRINWELPDGFSASEIQWPFPEVISSSDVTNYGYHGEVLLLTEITPPKEIETENVTIKANADWLVCKVICVPESAELSLSLPVRSTAPSLDEQWADKFAETRNTLPLKMHQWKLTAEKSDSSVILSATKPKYVNYNPGKIRFFPYTGGIFSNSTEQVINKTENGFTLEIFYDELKIEEPEKLTGILVNDNGLRGEGSERAIEIDVQIGQTDGGIITEKEGSGLWLAIVFAFMGGVILNLMPCVLPVLSIKILGFVEQSGSDKKKILEHGILFTVGVVVSFVALAGLLLIFRAGGEQLGWGFQLQFPVFLIILSVLLFLFGLSLFGVFEIGTSLTNVGSKLELSSGKFGAIMSGVAATVLATPCTAPFMGSALGFAITQPAFITLLVFTFLGLGMASPYLLLTIFPKWLKFIPKPGKWMETLKQFMGFLLMATIIWLAWVLGFQAGVDGLIGLMIALLFSGVAAWVYGKWGTLVNKGSVRITAVAIGLVLVVSSTMLAFTFIDDNYSSTSSKNSNAGLQWEEFSPQRLIELRNSNTPVFVDFTAAWCLSCQVNEKIALTPDEVVEKFKEKGIALLKADWTNRNEMITKVLAEFGRNSVPLYVLYDGKSAEPGILPEILTPGIVLDAIEKL